MADFAVGEAALEDGSNSLAGSYSQSSPICQTALSEPDWRIVGEQDELGQSPDY